MCVYEPTNIKFIYTKLYNINILYIKLYMQ